MIQKSVKLKIKKVKKIPVFIFFIVAALDSGAQSNCNIKKAYAFFTVSMPGMQMADENGNPVPPKPNIARYIYFEWTGANDPVIETVLYNNKTLTATLSPVEGNTVIPVIDFGNNSDHKITAKKCNRLWKVELHPQGDNTMPEQNCKNILIKTKGSGSGCQFKLIKETELAAMPRY